MSFVPIKFALIDGPWATGIILGIAACVIYLPTLIVLVKSKKLWRPAKVLLFLVVLFIPVVGTVIFWLVWLATYLLSWFFQWANSSSPAERRESARRAEDKRKWIKHEGEKYADMPEGSRAYALTKAMGKGFIHEDAYEAILSEAEAVSRTRARDEAWRLRKSGSSDIRWGGHGVSPPAVRSMRRR